MHSDANLLIGYRCVNSTILIGRLFLQSGGNSGNSFLCGMSMRCEYKSLKQLDRGWNDAFGFAGFWVGLCRGVCAIEHNCVDHLIEIYSKPCGCVSVILALSAVGFKYKSKLN